MSFFSAVKRCTQRVKDWYGQSKLKPVLDPIAQFVKNVTLAGAGYSSVMSSVLTCYFFGAAYVKGNMDASLVDLTPALIASAIATGVLIILGIVKGYCDDHRLKKLQEKEVQLHKVAEDLAEKIENASQFNAELMKTASDELALKFAQALSAKKTMTSQFRRGHGSSRQENSAGSDTTGFLARRESAYSIGSSPMATPSTPMPRSVSEASLLLVENDDELPSFSTEDPGTYHSSFLVYLHKIFTELLNSFPKGTAATLVGSVAMNIATDTPLFDDAHRIKTFVAAPLTGLLLMLINIMQRSSKEIEILGVERDIRKDIRICAEKLARLVQLQQQKHASRQLIKTNQQLDDTTLQAQAESFIRETPARRKALQRRRQSRAITDVGAGTAARVTNLKPKVLFQAAEQGGYAVMMPDGHAAAAASVRPLSDEYETTSDDSDTDTATAKLFRPAA